MSSFIDTIPTFKVVYGKNGYYWNDAVREEYFKRTGTHITPTEGKYNARGQFDNITNSSSFRRNPVIISIIEERRDLFKYDEDGRIGVAIAKIPLPFESFCTIDQYRTYYECVVIDYARVMSSFIQDLDDFRDDFEIQLRA